MQQRGAINCDAQRSRLEKALGRAAGSLTSTRILLALTSGRIPWGDPFLCGTIRTEQQITLLQATRNKRYGDSGVNMSSHAAKSSPPGDRGT
jgi:hypothetical protein